MNTMELDECDEVAIFSDDDSEENTIVKSQQPSTSSSTSSLSRKRPFDGNFHTNEYSASSSNVPYMKQTKTYVSKFKDSYCAQRRYEEESSRTLTQPIVDDNRVPENQNAPYMNPKKSTLNWMNRKTPSLEQPVKVGECSREVKQEVDEESQLPPEVGRLFDEMRGKIDVFAEKLRAVCGEMSKEEKEQCLRRAEKISKLLSESERPAPPPPPPPPPPTFSRPRHFPKWLKDPNFFQ